MRRTSRASRADAITNSPFVRALIKPMLTTIPTISTISHLLPPTIDEMISTQPLNMNTNTITTNNMISEVQLGKRKREEIEEVEIGEVEVCYTVENLPLELTKYWAQRYRLFSLYDQGCQMDIEGWYSVTPELVAVQIAERCRSNVIVDAFCGVGGNAIQFAFTCEKVIAIDNSPIRLACAKNNAKIYGVEDRITFILADFTTWSRDYLAQKERGEIKSEDEVEVIFLSPPWGGIDYQDLGTSNTLGVVATAINPKGLPSTPLKPFTPSNKSLSSTHISTDSASSISKLSYPLSAIRPLPGAELFSLARKLTPHIAYYLPRNTNMEEIATLPESSPWIKEDENGNKLVVEDEMIEVEEEWMGRKMKAVTIYFGELANGNCK